MEGRQKVRPGASVKVVSFDAGGEKAAATGDTTLHGKKTN